MSRRPRQAASFPRTIDNPGTYAQSYVGTIVLIVR